MSVVYRHGVPHEILNKRRPADRTATHLWDYLHCMPCPSSPDLPGLAILLTWLLLWFLASFIVWMMAPWRHLASDSAVLSHDSPRSSDCSCRNAAACHQEPGCATTWPCSIESMPAEPCGQPQTLPMLSLSIQTSSAVSHTEVRRRCRSSTPSTIDSRQQTRCPTKHPVPGRRPGRCHRPDLLRNVATRSGPAADSIRAHHVMPRRRPQGGGRLARQPGLRTPKMMTCRPSTPRMPPASRTSSAGAQRPARPRGGAPLRVQPPPYAVPVAMATRSDLRLAQ